MKKLSKDDLKKRDEFANKLDELAREIHEWRDSLVTDATDYYDNKSDNWREGDAGQAYSDWKDKIEDIDSSDVLDEVANALRELPEAPEG